MGSPEREEEGEDRLPEWATELESQQDQGEGTKAQRFFPPHLHRHRRTCQTRLSLPPEWPESDEESGLGEKEEEEEEEEEALCPVYRCLVVLRGKGHQRRRRRRRRILLPRRHLPS